MEVSRLRALRGPNLWTRETAIEAIVTLTPAEAGLDQMPGLEQRLRARLPALGQIRPSPDQTHASLAHALEAVALALQTAAGCPVSFSRTVHAVRENVYQVVVQYSEESVGRRAFEFAEVLLQAARDDTPFDLDAALAELRDLDEDIRLGPSTGAIVQAAIARGIPYRRLTEGSLVQFGWGARQKRIQAAETGRTSAIAEAIAQDKELTKDLLYAAGVPVPLGRTVESAADAWAAAQDIGLPVVVKPKDGNQGKGVAVNLSTREAVESAYAVAESFRDDVMVERYLPGNDFRLLVVGDRLIAAARRDPPLVTGDGTHTVRELVDALNRDPLRGEGHATSLTKIRLDEIALATLASASLTPDSVPAKGQRVVLRNNANLSTGGTATDVTDHVHPKVAQRAVQAAQMVGLDICGVDVVCDGVHRPLEETGGGIVEVNAAPGLRMHLAPSYGKPRAVGEAIVDLMFPPGEDGRIPVVAVSGTNGKTTTVRLIARMFRASGLRTGMTTTDGVYVGGLLIDDGDCSGPKSARNVLLHPDVDAAVFETARGGILREGLGFDRCDVAVVTNIGVGDHLGLNYINTVEDLSVVKRVIVQNVKPNGVAVLNAADPLVARMAEASPARVTLFARDSKLAALAAHRVRGERVVTVEGDDVVCIEREVVARFPLRQIPLTVGGAIGFQVENVLAAVGAGWGLGLGFDAIGATLRDFVGDTGATPGRFNQLDYRGATVIADYGHNPDAMVALAEAVDRIATGKRVVVISGAGDRRDEDIRRQTEILGDYFDEVILYQDACQRGRADGEVIRLLQEGLVGATRARHIEAIDGEFVAIDHGLERLAPGDLCLVLIDQVQEALAHLKARCTV
ncbi:MAG: cyanophycin synthetase [Rhodocyclaceae bacterium]|nr:cyanophycin synthetase [Rhodocyclaceae bacterium]